MSITLTCPSCSQMCAVADEHAGKQVACPRCRGVISVPAAGTVPAGTVPAAPVNIPPLPPPAAATSPFAFESAPPAPPPSAPGAPPAPPARGALAGLDDAARALGLDQFSKILVYAGWGCLCLLALTTLLPWRASFRVGTEDLALNLPPQLNTGSLGVSDSGGLMTLFFTLEIGFLLVFSFFLGKSQQFFQLGLWAAAWWGAHSVLWRFIDVIHMGRWAGWGLYLALVASLGVAGAFITLVVQRMSQRKGL
ncbi:MAG: hypothetical protein HY040_19875 [Planctomycetes bacterium]|nr:hypothetical protein [Planctomycetota bacterium]